MSQPGAQEGVAIVGIGCLVPRADRPSRFWRNLLAKVDVIDEVPRHRWDWRLYFDADRHAPDRIYSKWGGFIEDLEFDPLRYGMPPRSVKSVDPMQLMALEVARRALADAGYEQREFDREHTSVILGASGGGGDLGMQYGVRSELPRFLGELPPEAAERLPEWTEDSFPGTLINVVAGRIANRLNLGGTNLTTDAACASSLAAVYLAASELLAGRSNMAIAGGVDTVQTPFGYLCFSKTQALSPRGRCRTFDRGADGIVISEGIAMLVLKRLADARRDGDRVYAVVKGIAGSSDGKAKGLSAPLPAGQLRAMRRAYALAGFGPETVGLFEAHGTGTVAGDAAEVESTTTLVREAGGRPRRAAVGSVKSLLGHTKAAAGVVGMIKAALALHYRVLPPHAGVEEPLPQLLDPECPLYLVDEARPWLASADRPRRAAVSSFGFGGSNFHAVLEEHADEPAERRVPPRRHWGVDLLLWHGADEAALLGRLEETARELEARPPALHRLAARLAREWRAGGETIAVVARDLDDLRVKLAAAIAHVRGEAPALPAGVHRGRRTARPGKLAVLFPGQGSQHPEMLRELAVFFPEVADALARADECLRGAFPPGDARGLRLSDFVFPCGVGTATEKAAATEALKSTDVAQPALGAVEAGAWALLRRLGLRADMTAGHSYGELVALHAAGALDLEALLRLSAGRGSAIVDAARASGAELGRMAAAQASREVALELLAGIPDVVLANHNAPEQCIVSGSAAGVRAAMERFAAAGLGVTEVPVAAAFHSPFVAPARDALAARIARTELRAPSVPVYSNSTGEPYPADPAGVRVLLSDHLVRPVEFVAEVEAMHRAGARTFLEVGPKSVLTRSVGRILAGRPHTAIALDAQGRGLAAFLDALARLVCAGVALDVAALDPGDDGEDDASAEGGARPAHLWLLNGSGARPAHEPVRQIGFRLEEVEARGRTPVGAAAPAPARAPVPAAHAAPKASPTGAATPASASAPVAAASGAEAAPAPAQARGRDEAPTESAAPLPARARAGERPLELTAADPLPPPAPMTPATPEDAPKMIARRRTSSSDVEIMAEYFETMRKFLETQESVMARYLDGARRGLSSTSLPLAADETAHESGPPAPAPPRAFPAPAPPPSTAPRPVAPPAEPPRATATPAPPAAATVTAPAVRPSEPRPAASSGRNGGSATTVAAPAPAPAPAPAARVAPVPAAPPTPATTTGSGRPRAELQRILLRIVEEKTGYPPEMVGLDQNLEADLGIDSIKNVEIVGAFVKALPAAYVQALGEDRGRLTQPTLSGMLDVLESLGVGAPAAAPSAPAPAPAPAARVAPAPSAAPAAAPSIGDGLPRAELQRILLRIVEEKTGYPPEMVGLDQNLEADLGIDSIKNVEIVGAFVKALPTAYVQALGEDRGRLTQPTLSGMLDVLESLGVGAPAAAPSAPAPAPAARVAPAPAAPPAAAPSIGDGLPRAELQGLLLRIVEEKTGYPPEMVGLDQNLEADLGIDSIKNVEIVGAFVKALPAEYVRALGEDRGRLTQPTLNGMLDVLEGLGVGGQTVPFDRAGTGAAAGVSGHPFRYVLEAGIEPVGARAARRALAGTFLVVPDDGGVAGELATLLRRRGCDVLELGRERLADPEALRREVAALVERAELAGVVHLRGLSAAWLPVDAPSAAWREELQKNEGSLPAVLAAGARRLSPDAAVLAASACGGRFGRGEAEVPTPSAGLSVQGGAVGLLKSLREERPGLRVKAVDVDLALGAAEVAAILLQELELDGGRQEVGYPGGHRTVFRTVAAPRPAAPAAGAPARAALADLVVLATGGLRGVTAELLRELALPGVTLLLTGRTPMPGAEAEELRGAATAEELRRHFVAQVRAGRLALKPAEIERRIREVLAAREMRANLEDFRARGAVVEYFPVDVTDEAAVVKLFADVEERHGAVNGVVHGAGVLEDMLLENMTSAAWTRVVETKVLGLLHLQRHLRPDALRFLAVMSSVAGRYGNSGQTSYAAANELMNRLCCQLRAHWQGRVRVKAFCWGPWAATTFGAGMVTEETAAKFARKGVRLVRAEEGRRAFVAELVGPDDGVVEVVCGEGPWEEREAELGRLEPAAPASEAAGPLVAEAAVEDGALTVEIPASHAYLRDHELDGVPILPAAVALELLAEAAERARPGWRAVEVRECRALKGVAVTPESGPLRVELVPGAEDEESVELAARVRSMASAPPRLHYDAVVRLARRLPDAPIHAPRAYAPTDVTPAKAYAEWLVHGPRLRMVRAIGGLSPAGSASVVVPSVPGDWITAPAAAAGRWCFDPALVDAAAQMAWIWSRALRDETALPARFARVTRYAAPPAARLRMDFEVVDAEDPHRVAADVRFTDDEGRVVLAIERLESVSSVALNRLGARAGGEGVEVG